MNKRRSYRERAKDRLMDMRLYDQFVFRKRVLMEADEAVVCRRFQQKLGYAPDLKNPRTFCEKITWLLLDYRPPGLSLLADKYEVRKYVREKVGAVYLNELYGVYDAVRHIDWSRLPSAFVLKATHGSRWIVLCPDKLTFERKAAIREMKRWLSDNFYWYGREWIYRDIPPRIICEQFLDDGAGRPPPDYKFYCFDGIPKLIQVDASRFEDHRRNFYTPDWCELPVTMLYPRIEGHVRAPKRLAEMLDMAGKLAEGMPFVRVDLYEVNDAIIFGEMTFLPERGLGPFSDDLFDREVASWIQLPAPCRDKGFWSRLPAVLQ